MSERTRVVALEVVETSTGEVVHRVPLHGNNPDKVMRGMLRNMNREKFHVREVEETQKEQA